MEQEQIEARIQAIEYDLEQLRNNRIHELVKAPGISKCATIANRIKENLDFIVEGYEQQLVEKEDAAEREQFDLLSGMLTRLATEIETLSKKQPDGLVNKFKVGQINRVLKPLKEIMEDEPSAMFLDLVAEIEENADKSRNSYSDVAVILSQFREACGVYRAKHYDTRWNIVL